VSIQGKRYRIRDVLKLVREPVTVDPGTSYTEIGVRSFGRGIFHKDPVFGAALGSKKVYWIRSGEVVFNTVFAWEGAVAVSGSEDGGKIGSHRFMTLQCER
jgi:type I restriction enzyme S subunit